MNKKIKTYTLGETLDKMKFGEVAFIYKGHYNMPKNEFELKFSEDYFFYDEDKMGALVFSNGNYVIIGKTKGRDDERYVILDRELYFKLKG